MSTDSLKSEEPKNKWVETIGSIKSSLKFFALALLIVESLVGLLAIHPSANISELSYLAVIMFVLVVMMVTLLAYKKPRSLLAEKASDFDAIIDRLSRRQKYVVNLYKKEKATKQFEDRLTGLKLTDLKPMAEMPTIKRKAPEKPEG